MGQQQRVLGFVQVNVTNNGAAAGRGSNDRKMDVDPESRRRIRVAVMQQYRSQRRATAAANGTVNRSSSISSGPTDGSDGSKDNDHLSRRSGRSSRSPNENPTTHSLTSKSHLDGDAIIFPSAAIDNMLTRTLHNRLVDETHLTTIRTEAWWPERSCGCNGISTLLELHQQSPHEPRGPAIDALTLLTVGEAHGDTRLVMEGRRKHLLTIQRLRQQVARPEHVDHTAMVTTIEILLLCESLRTISRGKESWMQHCDGLAAVVSAAATAATTRQNAIAPALDHVGMLRVRHVCLMSALYNRRALDAQLLAAFTARQEPAPGTIEKLVQLALVLPVLLASSDHATQQATRHSVDIESLTLLSGRLRLLDTELRQWFADYQTSLTQNSCCCDISADFAGHGLFRFPWYNGLTSGARTSQRLCMSSFHITNCYAFLWSCRLVIHQTLFDLEEAVGLEPRLPRHSIGPGGGKSSDARADEQSREADDLAHSLREAIRYFTAIPTGSTCRMIATYGPLYFLKAFYRRTKHEEGSEWCIEIEQNMREQDSAIVEWDALAPWSFPGMIWALLEQLR